MSFEKFGLIEFVIYLTSFIGVIIALLSKIQEFVNFIKQHKSFLKKFFILMFILTGFFIYYFSFVGNFNFKFEFLPEIFFWIFLIEFFFLGKIVPRVNIKYKKTCIFAILILFILVHIVCKYFSLQKLSFFIVANFILFIFGYFSDEGEGKKQ